MNEPIRYDKKIFAENLSRLIRENGENQAQIARLLGVSRATLSAYCKGAQMARMDKIEQLAHHFGVTRAELLGDESEGERPAPPSQAEQLYRALNEKGRAEFLRYGRYLASQPDYLAAVTPIFTIKHYLVPAAAGYASPIEGEDYELIPRRPDTPDAADFCITIRGDSMEPYIPDGSLVYVKRDAPLREFEVGIFFVDGDVFCKQWCRDYAGTLHLLSANPLRRDANLAIARDSGRSCVCFGKVLLSRSLPAPRYQD